MARIIQFDMPALVRLSVLCALLFQVTMAYLPAHLQVRRQVVPYGAPNEDDHGSLVQDMQEKITVVDPDDSFPTKKKPTKKQFFGGLIRAVIKGSTSAARGAQVGVKAMKGINQARNMVLNRGRKQ
ncbi:unnamed protein product [Aphanomyces euteiches]